MTRKFARVLKAEVLRLLNETHHAHITWEEVAELGRQAGIEPEVATRQFMSLRGTVWNGSTTRSSDSELPWDVAHFDVVWFQRRGEAPIPWE